LVTPSVISFNATVSVCETFAAWHAALALLAEVGGAALVTYTSAISACGKASEWQQALELLELMEMKLLKADTISCNSAISACEKAGKWQEALSILQQACGEKPKVRSLKLLGFHILR
jgi:pentatricopeptide repeat domain-containing protein 1